jgi:hypothetical protein
VSEFDINAAIAEVIAEGTIDDPREIAQMIEIPDEVLRDVVDALLPDRVRKMIGQARREAFGTRHPVSPAATASAPGPSRWARFTPELLAAKVEVEGEWKELGDCTADDLDWLANMYAERAAKNQAYEERFRDLARRLRRSTATVLRDVVDASDVLKVAA